MRSATSQLSLHKIEVFCCVAELGSISRAAERLGLAQPVVTTHVRALSEKLGCKLTLREGRRIALTEDGQRVYDWAREMMRRTQELERELDDIRKGHGGKAALAASMTLGSYVLPAHLVAFRKRYPQAEISLQVMSPGALTEAVRGGIYDFAFTILDPRHDISELTVVPVGFERLILVTAPEARPAPERIGKDELLSLGFVTARSGQARREIEEHALMAHGVGRRRVAMEMGHAEAIKQAVRAGAGVAFLFESSVRDELSNGTLAAIGIDGVELEVPTYCVRRAKKRLSAFQERLLSDLVAGLEPVRAGPAGEGIVQG